MLQKRQLVIVFTSKALIRVKTDVTHLFLCKKVISFNLGFPEYGQGISPLYRLMFRTYVVEAITSIIIRHPVSIFVGKASNFTNATRLNQGAIY